jgi:hypothetical protein
VTLRFFVKTSTRTVNETHLPKKKMQEDKKENNDRKHHKKRSEGLTSNDGGRPP